MNNTLTTIYLVRHGQSQGNALADKNNLNPDTKQHSVLGSPLTELGREQAAKIAERLSNVHLDAIYSSDLLRAQETARIIAAKRRIEVTTESTIRERYWGNGDKGMSKTDRLEIEKSLQSLNDEKKLLYRYYPDGETAMEGVNRLLSFLNKMVPLYKGKTILVVNHGNIMRSLLIHLKWASYTELPPGSIDNTGYYVLETDGKTYKVLETHGVNKINIISSQIVKT